MNKPSCASCSLTGNGGKFSSVLFSSAQDGIYALGKAHMCSTPSLRSFPSVSLETVGKCTVEIVQSLSWPEQKFISKFVKMWVKMFTTLYTN